MSQKIDFLALHRSQPKTPSDHPGYNKVIATDDGLQVILPDGRVKTLLNSEDTATQAAAQAAAQATTLIGTLAVPKTGNVFTFATVPSAAENTGRTIYVSDGSEGAPCAAISDGTDWLVISLGAAISDE